MKIAVAGWKIPAYGAWGAGAVMAFIGSFLPWVEVHIGFGAHVISGTPDVSGTTDVAETTTLMLAVVAFGAMLILLIAKPPEALPASSPSAQLSLSSSSGLSTCKTSTRCSLSATPIVPIPKASTGPVTASG